MHTRIPKLIAEINTIIADHSDSSSEEEQAAIELLKRARDALGVARAKLQEADVKKHRLAAGH
jgi:pyrroloquinoline quinone (PQQ) biosynthesis protein C